jgi:hypothetical protein
MELISFVILNEVKNLEMTGRRFTYPAFTYRIRDSSLRSE